MLRIDNHIHIKLGEHPRAAVLQLWGVTDYRPFGLIVIGFGGAGLTFTFGGALGAGACVFGGA
jgi:hypothetical protein